MSDDFFRVEIDVLRPTQFCAGFREVEEKRKELEHESRDDRHDYLHKHPVPLVQAPDEAFYLIDHHHLARALHDAGFSHARGTVVADLRSLHWDAFWQHLQQQHWIYLVDAHGQPQSVSDLPKHVAGLHDDPYRSLAGFLRKAGVFSKDEAPFAEFRWAEFFRSRIRIKPGDTGFEQALQQARELAHSAEARKLPGYCSKG